MAERIRSVLSGLGLLVGVIIGAGMFVLPYTIARAGIVWGSVHAGVAFAVITLIHLLYGEIVFSTPGAHRLPGYAKIYLGQCAKSVSFLSALIGFYGALLVYGLLGGVFLAGLAGGDSSLWSLLFFAVGGCILFFDLRRIGTINFILTFVLIGVIVLLSALLMPHVEFTRIPLVRTSEWFLPYGVFLFAFAGASAIPDVADVFRRQNERLFRRIVVFSTLIPLVLYALFIVSVVGVMGEETTKEAIFGLERFVGSWAIILGSIIGLLAVFTSFLALGADLKNIFIYDYSWRPALAWGITAAVPLILYFSDITDFLAAIGLVGAVAVGIDSILILAIALKVCRQNGGCRVGSFLIGRRLLWILIVLLAAGVLYKIFQTFFT